MKTLFSGIQPTGNLHIGNYLGAIRQWVSLQQDYRSIFCVVDLHAITVHQDPAALKAKTRKVAAIYIAAGIDPSVSSIFIQSEVSAHAELAWILECVIPFGWLTRMTQYKDKAQHAEQVSAGLFNYPALMAADILLYDTDVVPVGEDQVQHLELTRDTAQRFNFIYGDTFRLPQAITPESGARIMGLDDPIQKMSKSNPLPNHAVRLLDSANSIKTKIARATTDSLKEIRFDKQRPGVQNLLVLYQSLTGLDAENIEAHFSGKGYADLKRELTEVVINTLQPIQTRYSELSANPDYIDSILEEGTDRVRPIAMRTLQMVKDRLGLG